MKERRSTQQQTTPFGQIASTTHVDACKQESSWTPVLVVALAFEVKPFKKDTAHIKRQKTAQIPPRHSGIERNKKVPKNN